MTARELAGELEVSIRTIYRDLEALSTSGVPVVAEAGPGGGCQLLEDYRFPLRGLRPEEAEALLILGVPDALRDLGLDGAVAAAHRQIRVTSGRTEPEAVLIHLDLPRWFRGQESVPCLRDLATALRRHQQVRLVYKEIPRVVMPLGLVNKAGTWYLIAATRADRIPVFRAGKITDVRILDEPVSRPPGFDLATFWDQWSREFQSSLPKLTVRIRASPDALKAFPEIFGDGVPGGSPDEHGWRELSLTFEHEKAAVHRLAGFGDQVEVLVPAAVREQIVAAARGILNRYANVDRSRIMSTGSGSRSLPPIGATSEAV
jgi:predicted DNA-binding transcriptional regulator YafY